MSDLLQSIAVFVAILVGLPVLLIGFLALLGKSFKFWIYVFNIDGVRSRATAWDVTFQRYENANTPAERELYLRQMERAVGIERKS